MAIVSVLKAIALLPAASFLLAVLALPIARMRLADETTDDLRSVRRRSWAALRGEWPDRPAAIWYRRVFAILISSWGAEILLILVINMIEAPR